jgi:hypothetical protein
MFEIKLESLRNIEYRDKFIDDILKEAVKNLYIRKLDFLDYLYSLYETIKQDDYLIRTYIFYGISVIYTYIILGLTSLNISEEYSNQIIKFDELIQKEKMNPQNPFVNLFAGLIIFQMDINKSMKMCSIGIYDVINSTYIDNPLRFIQGQLWGCHLLTNAINFKDILIQKNNEVANENAIKIHTNKLNKKELFIINFTCDIIYFLALAENTINILLGCQDVDKFGIFIHIIYTQKQFNNTDLIKIVDDKITDIINLVSNKSTILFTYESTDAIDKALFTTNRFTNMANFLKITNKDIIQMDIDIKHLDGMKFIEFYNKYKHCDFALFKNTGLPWQKFAAGFSYWGNNKVSRIFSDSFNKILKVVYDNNKVSNWFIDQYCLYLTYLFLIQNSYAELTIGSIWNFLKKTPGIFEAGFKLNKIKAAKEEYKDLL